MTTANTTTPAAPDPAAVRVDCGRAAELAEVLERSDVGEYAFALILRRMAAHCTRLLAENERLRRRVAQLEAALRPFAEYGAALSRSSFTCEYETVLMRGGEPTPDVQVGHCRRAAVLLAGDPPAEGGVNS